MFEQLVRPFTSRQVTTTRRIVPIKTDDTPGEAKITWGVAGALPEAIVQPKGTNLENIESIGFNVRGNIDNWNQSVREGEQVTIPVRDNAGNQVGETVIDRTKSITFNGRPSLDDAVNNSNLAYLPNYHGTAEMPPQQKTSPKSTDTAPSGLRQNVPGKMIEIQQFNYDYENYGGDSSPS